MDEILKISWEINYSNLVYDFKDPTPSISFAKFGGAMYTYKQLKKWSENTATKGRRSKNF